MMAGSPRVNPKFFAPSVLLSSPERIPVPRVGGLWASKQEESVRMPRSSGRVFWLGQPEIQNDVRSIPSEGSSNRSFLYYLNNNQ